MRVVTYLVLGVVALALVLASVANRHAVLVRGWPDMTEYGVAAPPEWRAPLFVVALGAGALGFVLGALREYLRETRYRRGMSARGREIGELKREVRALRDAQGRDEDDEIIAITSR